MASPEPYSISKEDLKGIAKVSKKPNVLLLMSDQHNANCMSVSGHPNVKTPFLDSIAKQGIRFENAFCNNPICSPSRISFITGQYPHTHGMLGNDNFNHQSRNGDSLAAVFRRYGYQTALIGKAHMIKKWDDEGFEHIRYRSWTKRQVPQSRT